MNIQLVLSAGKPGKQKRQHLRAPPFYWLVNGRPLGREHHEAITSYSPQGPGLIRITLMDSRGKRDTVSVWLADGGESQL